MTPQRILIALFAYTTGLSFALTYRAAQGIVESPSISLVSSLVFALLVFAWYWADSQARSFRRPPLLSIAVIAVAFIAIPYYLFLSRPSGERLKTFGNLLAVVGLLLASMILGGLPVALL